MGRPLNKRFFDPVPSSNGEGVASVTVTDGVRGNYAVLPTVEFSAPELPGGATPTSTRVMRLRGTVSVNAGGTGYTVGNILTISGGTTTAGTYTTQAAIRVASVDGVTGAITGFSAFTVSPSSRGAYTVLPAKSGSSTTALDLAYVTGSGGSGATANVTWEVSALTVTDSGSGYVDVPTVTFTGGTGDTNATGTAALTTTGTNVILATAFVVGGTAPLDADIIKQTSTNEYVMQTTEGQSVVTLVADDTPVEGQASITATDALGETYWVMKLTSRLALLERKGGAGVYESGETAPWSLESTTLDPSGQTVQITSA